MTKWNVYLNNRIIDTVFYTSSCEADYIKNSLISHDGYDCRIIVRKARG
jgi:hypothetical protein